jgi:hypothetical protein
MFKKIISLTIALFCIALPSWADKAPLFVVHNVYDQGFSINGYDLFYDDGNKSEIKLGDQFYIDSIETEKITNESHRNILFLTNPNNKESKYFKSRITSNEESMLIIEVNAQSSSQSYEVTLDDGSKYTLYGNYKINIQPGDRIFFPDKATLEDSYTLKKTWHYPFCTFDSTKVTRDNTPLGSFKAVGLFRKPISLIDLNTFRIRWADVYEKGRGFLFINDYFLVEFFDFYPGCKFSVNNRADLAKVKSGSTLQFVKKIDDRKFIFENSKQEQIILSLDLKLVQRSY